MQRISLTTFITNHQQNFITSTLEECTHRVRYNRPISTVEMLILQAAYKRRTTTGDVYKAFEHVLFHWKWIARAFLSGWKINIERATPCCWILCASQLKWMEVYGLNGCEFDTFSASMRTTGNSFCNVEKRKRARTRHQTTLMDPWININVQLHAIYRIVNSEHVTTNLFRITWKMSNNSWWYAVILFLFIFVLTLSRTAASIADGIFLKLNYAAVQVFWW